LLYDLADRGSQEARAVALFAHPELFAPEVEKALRAELELMPTSDRAPLAAALDEMVTQRLALELRPVDYVIADGPVERLWSAVGLNELDLEHAMQLAPARAADAVLAPIYVDALRSAANHVGRVEGAAAALLLLGITLAAIEGRPGGALRDRPGRETCLSFADHARIVLSDDADGRLFRHAYRLVSGVVDWARAAEEEAELAHALRTLGNLHLHPWVSRRRVDQNLEKILWRWERRAIESHADDFAGIPEDEWQMPPAREAMSTALRLLHEAADLLHGHERALVLKGCVEARGVLRALGQDIDRADLVDTATKALALLAPDRDPQECLFLLNVIRAEGGEVNSADVEAALTISVDEQIRRHALGPAADILRQASMALSRIKPARALEVARDLGALSALADTERDREELWIHQLNLSESAYSPELALPGDVAALDSAAADLRRRAADEAWDVMRLAGGLLRLARGSANIDAEARGLELLDELQQLVPAYAVDTRMP